VPATPITQTGSVSSQSDLLLGWSLAETSGSVAAGVEIHDAAAATRMIASVNLDPGESTGPQNVNPPLQLSSGSLYVVVTGSVEGAIWWA